MMQPNVQSALQRLDDARHQWWLYSLLVNLSLAAGLWLAAYLAVVTADTRWQFSSQVRIGLFLLWCGCSMGLLAAVVIHALIRQRSLAAAARRLELAFPELGNDLINLVQIAEHPADDAYRDAAAAEAASRIANVPLEGAAVCYGTWGRWRLQIHTADDVFRTVAFLLLLLAAGLVMYCFVPGWWRSANRVLPPWPSNATYARISSTT